MQLRSSISRNSNKWCYKNWDPIWKRQRSSGGAVSEFEIKDNIYYFSAPDLGKYEILLSVETKEGESILDEKFNYLALDFIAKAEKQ